MEEGGYNSMSKLNIIDDQYLALDPQRQSLNYRATSANSINTEILEHNFTEWAKSNLKQLAGMQFLLHHLFALVK